MMSYDSQGTIFHPLPILPRIAILIGASGRRPPLLSALLETPFTTCVPPSDDDDLHFCQSAVAGNGLTFSHVPPSAASLTGTRHVPPSNHLFATPPMPVDSSASFGSFRTPFHLMGPTFALCFGPIFGLVLCRCLWVF